ncbi:fmn-dependent dehydrogenase [Trichoderma arundinaceum]|uniref:Fmn-dependent dehydrogenase n=1 Tax=Trichoderma arundinaceum TaxID=490622 RepID=A0A395NIL2_TRIAR|nr:fmn-dependent dehydrogenase [Trichoderma arundinaceum]
MIKPDYRDGPPKDTSQYASHIAAIYHDGVFANQLPIVTTNPVALEDHAREVMSETAFGYIYGGAGEMSTMDANRLAFRQWKLIPRCLKPCCPRSLDVELFGVTYKSPVIMAPVGVQGFFHPHGEKGLVEACTELRIPYILSTAATSTIEDIGDACGAHPHWYQLYWPKDNEITVSLLTRAQKSGYSTLVVTLDTVAVAWRPHDLDIANLPFLTGTGNAVGFSDPVFRAKFSDMTHGDTPEGNPVAASKYWIGEVFSGEHHSWEDLQLLRNNWNGPIVLKGIMCADDARLAYQYGIDGIVVSNHGGRQLDGAVASLEMLPEIVEAVGNKMTILFDSGIRTGADIMKALALGADAVFVARPVLYGFGIAGKEGAKSVLAGLLADLDQSMKISGFSSIKELNSVILKRVSYGGDMRSTW